MCLRGSGVVCRTLLLLLLVAMLDFDTWHWQKRIRLLTSSVFGVFMLFKKIHTIRTDFFDSEWKGLWWAIHPVFGNENDNVIVRVKYE